MLGIARWGGAVLLGTIGMAAGGEETVTALGMEISPSSPVVAGTSESCLSCHLDLRGRGHPLGDRMPEGSGLPGEAALGLGCLTCHDSGTVRDDHRKSRASHLREIPRVLCRRCHRDPEPGSRLGHTMDLGRAHASGGRERGDRKAFLGGVDRISLGCLGCHDGSVASEAKVDLPGEPRIPGRAGSGLQHPIGARSMVRGAETTPPSPRPTRSDAREGILGCLSCHDPWSPWESQLSRNPEDGGLCRSCHVK